MAQQLNIDLLNIPKGYPLEANYSRKYFDDLTKKYRDVEGRHPGYINKDAFFKYKFNQKLGFCGKNNNRLKENPKNTKHWVYPAANSSLKLESVVLNDTKNEDND